MAQSLTVVSGLAFSSTTDASSYTTSSHTLNANNRVIIVVGSAVSSGTPNTPTLSGHSLTYNLITVHNTETIKVSVFDVIVGGSNSTDTIVADFGGQTQLRCTLIGAYDNSSEWSRKKRYGFIVKTQGSDTSLSLTPGVYGHSKNRILATVYKQSTGTDFSDPSGWTRLAATGGSEAHRQVFLFYNGQPSGAQTWTWGTSGSYIGILIEMRDKADDFVYRSSCMYTRTIRKYQPMFINHVYLGWQFESEPGPPPSSSGYDDEFIKILRRRIQ